MKPPLVYHEAYSAPLPSTHRFPMAKFRQLEGCLRDMGLASDGQMHRPLPVPRRWLELVHSRGYHQAFARDQLDRQAQRRIGLPATTPLVQRTWLAVGGTLLTARLALQHGVACHLAGGTHHAFPDFGSGFCIFNDLAITARVLLEQERLQCLLVVDLDVHQGDATALIFQGDARVFTFSAHAASNFPARKQVSDLDLPFQDGVGDQDYLSQVGMGRTGTLWGYEQLGVVPDALTLAKGLGGGHAVGALMVRSNADVFEPGDHASTFGGNPFACRAGLTVASEIERRNLLSNVRERGDQLRAGLDRLVERYPDQLAGSRGWGLLQGLVLKDDCGIQAVDVVKAALEEQLLLVPAGAQVVRMVPALVISSREVQILLTRLERALVRVT